MSVRPVNMAASIRRKLLAMSQERYEDFNLVLVRYGLERFLYRLGQSRHADKFVLKGAMLFAIWTDKFYRPTRDLDLLGYGENSTERLTTLFQEICQVEVESDGLFFDPASIKVDEIREDQEYHGKRIRLITLLAKAQIPIQIDIGFGDVVTPSTKKVEYPTLLELPPPRILAYPKETVVSEKLQAMVALGMVNSRMKDFYDLWIMSRYFKFEGESLVGAIKATFSRRKTPIPKYSPTALTEEFAKNIDKRVQWKAFLNKTRLADSSLELLKTINGIRSFVLYPLLSAANDEPFVMVWDKSGPWKKLNQ